MFSCFDDDGMSTGIYQRKTSFFHHIFPKCVEDNIMTYVTRPLTLESKWRYDAWSNGILHTSVTTDGKIHVFSRWGLTDVNIFNKSGERQKNFKASSELHHLNQAIRCHNVMWTHMNTYSSIYIWNADSGEVIRSIDLPSMPSVEVSFAFAGGYVLIVCDDGKFYLFREDGTFLRSFVANSSHVFEFFAFNGTEIFVSCCETKRVQVYDLNGNLIRSIGKFKNIYSVAVYNKKVFVIGVRDDDTFEQILYVFSVNGRLLTHFSFEADTIKPALVILSSGHILIRDMLTIRIYKPVCDD